MSKVVAVLRSLLRFLTTEGMVSSCLDAQIDSPRAFAASVFQVKWTL
jgi:hypothetical protein